ncbi:MAG: GGDEF domain-containing protein [Wenzhouxiangella sp.]|nr:GGDEF domain-containing protein [Wenzhouxiangella sp.]
MSSRDSGRVPLPVRLFPLRQRITLVVYLTVLLALVVGAGAWVMTQINRAQIISLSNLVNTSQEVRQYRTLIDQMQFASFRFVASDHQSAPELVSTRYRQTRKSIIECMQNNCSDPEAMTRMERLLSHLDAFHDAFQEAVEQREAINVAKDRDFSTAMGRLRGLLPRDEVISNSAAMELLNDLQRHLRDLEAAVDVLWRNDSVSSDLVPEFSKARDNLESLAGLGVAFDFAQAEAALNDLAQLYRQLLQRSRGHQFLVNVVMAGDAHEMQRIAELLEDDLNLHVAAAQEDIYEHLRFFTIALIVILLIGSAVIFYVGRVMANSVGRQISRLSRIFSELAAGSETPIRFTSLHNDEVGELVRAAERFREENVERHALIDRYRKLNEELEAKVDQRTLALRSSNEELELLANTDRLTGASNRRALDVALTAELDRSRRYESGLSVLFLDLDHFKEVNDRYGHGIGDQVLRGFVTELRRLLRDSDILGRWGGEEFIVICPETNASDVLHLADRIRARIAEIDFGGAGKITVSIGVAELSAEDNAQDLVDRADQALYEAKKAGRNRCVLAT